MPLAYVDLELFDRNAEALIARARGLPIRLATKSVRSVAMLRYVLDRFPAFRGLMAFSPGEAAFLAEQGFDDILIGYPSVERSELKACLRQIAKGKTIIFMIDSVEHVEILSDLGRELELDQIPLCIDLDLSTHFPFLHFGIFRSPLRTFADMGPLLKAIKSRSNLKVLGLMGYEGQIAGVADQVPGSKFYSFVVRILKALSQRESFKRRQEATAGLKSAGFTLAWVNGGGTGSLEETCRDPSVTEVTVGSGLYSPALFDHYKNFRHLPSCGFILPVVRKARSNIYACSGGGYVASGPVNNDKQPRPFLPAGIELFKTLGAGEVQTSIRSPQPLQLGSPVFFRHAKAGELCERFNRLFLLRAGRIEDIVLTYRGQGLCFF